MALIRRSSLGLVLWIARIVDCPEHLRSVPCSRGKDCSLGAAHLDHRSGPNTKKIAGIEPGTIENLACLPSSQPMAEIPNGWVVQYLRLHIDHVPAKLRFKQVQRNAMNRETWKDISSN